MTDYLAIGSKKIEYQWHGPLPGDAPTLIFLHEGLGCVSMWKDFPEKLAEKSGCGALVYSRFGYGESDSCSLPRNTKFMHEEGLDVLPGIIEKTGTRDHILIGHSDGGSISLIYAGGLCPTSLLGVVSIASHVFCETVTLESIRKAKKAWEKGNLKEKLYRYHKENTEVAFRGWNDVWLDPAFVNWNIEEFLFKIEAPVLAVQGENDPYGTREQVDRIVKNVKGPALPLMVPECGHAPHLENPSLLLDVLAAFILNPGAMDVDNSCNF
ncbi:MAG: alpha/beta hydrolase [Desulfobacteraceae bacterium]